MGHTVRAVGQLQHPQGSNKGTRGGRGGERPGGCIQRPELSAEGISDFTSQQGHQATVQAGVTPGEAGGHRGWRGGSESPSSLRSLARPPSPAPNLVSWKGCVTSTCPSVEWGQPGIYPRGLMGRHELTYLNDHLESDEFKSGVCPVPTVSASGKRWDSDTLWDSEDSIASYHDCHLLTACCVSGSGCACSLPLFAHLSHGTKTQED